MARKFDIPARLRPFVDAGLLSKLPTHEQIAQGEVEMLPYVISDDATVEPRYQGSRFGHPAVRQPILFAFIGRDHLDTGTGIACELDSVIKHLHFTYHQGMPVWDLQVIQTHPNGLQTLREETEAMLERRTLKHRARMTLLEQIIPRPEEYLREFLGDDGHIARAERFEYPSPTEEDAAFPNEFFDLVRFLDYCAHNFPEKVEPLVAPKHYLGLLMRRRREGKTQGWAKWLERDPRDATAKRASAHA